MYCAHICYDGGADNINYLSYARRQPKQTQLDILYCWWSFIYKLRVSMSTYPTTYNIPFSPALPPLSLYLIRSALPAICMHPCQCIFLSIVRHMSHIPPAISIWFPTFPISLNLSPMHYPLSLILQHAHAKATHIQTHIQTHMQTHTHTRTRTHARTRTRTRARTHSLSQSLSCLSHIIIVLLSVLPFTDA